MPEIPEGATVPQDHLPSDEEHAAAVAADLSDDELLADMPELIPPTRLRIRQRNKVMALAIGLRSFAKKPADGDAKPVDDGESEEDEAFDLDLDDLTDEELEKFLGVLASIDEFAQSIAVNEAEYVTWAEGQDYDVFSALLSRYSSAVGKSKRSSA